MKIEKIEICDFRNIDCALLTPHPNVNIIYGKNAQGKTNLLESIWLCSGKKSFRKVKENQMIGFNKDFFKTEIIFSDKERFQNIKLHVGEKRKIFLNDVPLKSFSELFGNFYCVIFNPDDLDIVKGGPSSRRDFLDTAISQIKPIYGKYLSKYMDVLEQRNVLLREIKNNNYTQDMLDIWDIQLAKLGTIISIFRSDYLKKLNTVSEKIYKGFTNGKEKINIKYYSTIYPESIKLELYSDELIAEYQKILLESREDDIRIHTTTKGIHRDDFDIEIDNLSSKLYGSQGQQRSSAITLKLSEATLLKNITGENPIILLDDVMSELDNQRQSYILNKVKNFQVFITCCDILNTLKLKEGKIFLVENGVFIEKEEKNVFTSGE